MSNLTKVFVLLVSALALFLCGTTVTFVANTENWKEKYLQQSTLAEAAQVQALVAEESKSRDLARYETLNQALRNNLLALEQQNSDLLRRWTIESQSRAQAEGTVSSAVESVQALRETIQNMYTVQHAIDTELKDSHQAMITAQAQVIDLGRQLNSERAKSAQLDAESRRRLEKIYALENENNELRRKMLREEVVASREMEYAEDQVALTAPGGQMVPIRGEITGLDNEMASISVGSAAGVRKNMRFLVIRGNRYLGDLVVTHVEPSESAGRLTRLQGTVVEGDRVTTAFD